MNDPILSVIIPHRNNADKLPILLDSIMQQTFKELEVIVVDDNSTQSIAPIITAYKNKGLPIRCLENSQRIFTRKARTMGVQAACGRIISFADSDDILLDHTSMEYHVNIFLEHRPDILHFRYCHVNQQGEIIGLPQPDAEPILVPVAGEKIFDLFSQRNPHDIGSLWNKYYAKHLCEKTIGISYPESIKNFGEDLLANSLYFYHATTYMSSQRVGYGYNFHNNSYVQKSYGSAIAFYNIFTFMTNYLKKEHCPPELLEQYKKNIIYAVAVATGTACRELFRTNQLARNNEYIHNFLSHADEETWLKVLILANGYNADKISRTYEQIK